MTPASPDSSSRPTPLSTPATREARWSMRMAKLSGSTPFSSLHPDHSRAWALLLYLQAGAAVVVSADYLAESILDAALGHQATFLYVTPMHVRMLAGEGSGRALPPSLKRVMSVSSRLDPQAARGFLAKYHVPVAQGYGIIEVGLPIMNIDEADRKST